MTYDRKITEDGVKSGKEQRLKNSAAVLLFASDFCDILEI